MHRTYEEFIDLALNQYDFRVMPLLPHHMARLIGLPFHHKDPFDRLIVAQTLAEGLSIIRVDSQFDPYGVHKLW